MSLAELTLAFRSAEIDAMTLFNHEISLGPSLKIKPVMLVFLFLAVCASSQLINSANAELQAMIMSREGITASLWFLAALQILGTFFSETVLFLLAAACFFSFKNLTHFLRDFNAFLIENLRSWGKILLGFIFLILPGGILFFRYMLVPFVVVFDPEYDRGNVDALERSRALVSALTLPQWLILVFLKIALPLFISMGFEEVNVLQDGKFLFIFRQVIEVIALLSFVWIIQGFVQTILTKHPPEKAEL